MKGIILSVYHSKEFTEFRKKVNEKRRNVVREVREKYGEYWTFEAIRIKALTNFGIANDSI